MKLTKQELSGRFDGKLDELTVTKSSKDGNGIYTILTYKRKGTGTTYAVSTLSAPNAEGQYVTRTEKYYDRNGTTQLDTITYTLAYDADGDIISEL
jgi:hypothetical protein